MYENAQEFAKARNISALKEQLGLLWHDAPYYGDPTGLARLAGLKGPTSFQEAMNAQNKVSQPQLPALTPQQEAIRQVRKRYEQGSLSFDRFEYALNALLVAQTPAECQAILQEVF